MDLGFLFKKLCLTEVLEGVRVGDDKDLVVVKHVRKVPFYSEHYVADDALIRVYTIIKLLSIYTLENCQ